MRRHRKCCRANTRDDGCQPASNRRRTSLRMSNVTQRAPLDPTRRQGVADIVQCWQTRVFRLAHRVTSDRDAAEDVRQTVFLRIVEGKAPLDRPAALAAWIRRSTVNAAIDLVRSRNRRGRLLNVFARQRPTHGEGTAAGEAELADETDQLRAAMGALDPDDRALLALRFDEDLTYDEIAAVVERPLSTVKSQLERAKKRLRSEFKRTKQE